MVSGPVPEVILKLTFGNCAVVADLLSKTVVARTILAVAVFFSILSLPNAEAANLTLAWNPSPSPNVNGYVLQYGVAVGQYPFILSAGTNTTMTVSGLSPGQTYYFVVSAYNFAGGQSADSNVLTNTMPLQMLAQPISQTAIIGAVLVLSVEVSSATPVSFQWFFGGVAIEGSTNSVLILPEVSGANAGRYTVVASNAGGSVTSQVAIISVLDSAILPATSIYPVPPGTYNGLFYQTNTAGSPSVTELSTGLLANCTVGLIGTYSLRLVLAGQTFNLSGVLSLGGKLNTIVNRSSSGLSNLSLTVFADPALGGDRLTGVVSNMSSAAPWVALLTASQATNAFSPAEDLVFLSPPPPGQPGTNFTCQLIIAPNGVASLAGQLGDGTTISQTASIGADGGFPVYLSLYNNTGLLAGWITLAEGAPVGNLTWIQLGNPMQSKPGFTNVISFGSGPGLSTNCFQLIQ